MQARMQRDAYRARYRSYSRGSIVGPLLLIGIGVVALLLTTHRIDPAGFWQWYGRWWPLILIGAGAVLALESLAFSASSRIRLGGGVVLLGIVLALIGVAAAHNNVNWSAVGDQLDFGNGNVNLAQMFGDKHEATEQVNHYLPANASVIVQNPHGDVTIASSGEAAGGMHLTLNKFVYTDSNSEAQRKLGAMEPLITEDGTVVTVHMPTNDSQTADMVIAVPAKTAIQVQSGHGDVTIKNMQAGVVVDAQHGDMQLTGIAGLVHATMHQGDFSASDIQGDVNVSGHMNDVTLSRVTGNSVLDGDFFGDVQLEKLQGGLHLHSSRTDIQLASLAGAVSLDSDDLTIENANGPVTVTTEAKDIELRQVTGEVRVRNANGSVEVGALNPVAAMNIDNRNGSVELTLPSDAKFSVHATADDGTVHSDFPLTIKQNNDASIASGAAGGGGPLIQITAEKGDIALHKR